MSDNPPRFPFSIRKIEPGREPQRAAVPSPTPPPPPPLEEVELPIEPPAAPEPASPATAGIGARFSSAGPILAFLSACSGAGIQADAVVRRSPEGFWWIESGVAFESAREFVIGAGGRPYRPRGPVWVPTQSDGRAPRTQRDAVDPHTWPSLDLAAVVAFAPRLAARYYGATELNILLPAELGQWLLRRTVAIGLNSFLVPVSRIPLGGGDSSHALLVRIESTGQAIRRSFVHALSQLPYCVVGGPRLSGQGTLVVDVRQRLPFPASLLTGAIPHNDLWILGAPEAGAWRVHATTNETEGSALLSLPDLPLVSVPEGIPGQMPEEIAIHLVDRPSPATVDAVLLDDFELKWAQKLLMSRPIGEVAFLIPGEGRHFLSAPGGLGAHVPFGTPLARIGPGPLFIEIGKGLYPPMPEAARRARFALDDESVVAIAGDAAYRFAVSHQVPTWTLWVGPAPQIKDGLSPDASRLLKEIGEDLRRRELAMALQASRAAAAPAGTKRQDPAELFEEALRQERRGNLREAAELLESAGQPARAARLFERAARLRR